MACSAVASKEDYVGWGAEHQIMKEYNQELLHSRAQIGSQAKLQASHSVDEAQYTHQDGYMDSFGNGMRLPAPSPEIVYMSMSEGKFDPRTGPFFLLAVLFLIALFFLWRHLLLPWIY